MARRKKYTKPSHEIDLHTTVAKAKELLGWTVVEKGEPYHLKDLEGQYIRFKNNTHNRPFRKSLADKYANEMLRGKWTLNGHNLIFDWYGGIISAQHRLAALVLAEQERKRNPVHWQEEYGLTKPITVPFMFMFGIDPATADTVDLGQKRSLGDVLFRRDEFADVKLEGKPLTERKIKQLSDTLGQSVNLLWKRWGGKNASDAKGHPHSESLDLIEEHPLLKKALLFIFEEDGGSGEDGQRIRAYCSLSIATGMMYLMGTANSKVDIETGDCKIVKSSWEKAEEFWVKLASGEGLKEGDPILVLSKYLVRQAGSGAGERDRVYGAIVKAWNLWIEGKKAKSAKDIRVKEKNVDGERKLAEYPRIGGLDVARDAQPTTKIGKWSLGDYAWVNDEETEPWQGVIVKFDKDQIFLRAEDNEVYEASIDWLSGDQPEIEDEENEEDLEDDYEEEGEYEEEEEEELETAAA